MSERLKKFTEEMLGFSFCSTPEPENPDDAKKSEEEPIIFDESENPVLQEQARKHPLRPSSFEMVMQPLRMATMVEPLEGLKIDFSFGLSQRFQLQNSWTLAHGQGGGYDVNFMYVGGKMANPYDFVSPNPFMMARWAPGSGRQDIRYIYKWHEDLEMKLVAQYMSFDPRESHVQLEADHLGDDYVAGVKAGISLENISFHYMQSLTKDLQLGFELMGMRKPRAMVDMSYGGKYTMGVSSFYMQYLAQAKMFQLGAVIKGNPNITYSTELTYSGMNQNLEFVGGMSVRFTKAKFNTQITGSGKLMAGLTHVINPFLRFSLHADADLVKQEQKFGIGIQLGG